MTTATAAEPMIVFPDDDEETWKVLVALNADYSVDAAALLSGLATRLQEDWGVGEEKGAPAEEFWVTLVTAVSNHGFEYSDGASTILPIVNGLGAPPKEIPVAFQTEAGMNHIAATSALLGLSQERAVQVTMGALRSIDIPMIAAGGNDSRKGPAGELKEDESSSTDHNFASLLGSRDLLYKTVLYHHQQRFARLSVITESLRLEQDPDFVHHPAIVAFLKSLDTTFSNSSNGGTTHIDRGLLKSLLTVACQPEPKTSREALGPLQELEAWSGGSSSSYRRGIDRPLSDEMSFQAFCISLIAEQKAQTLRERTEAMEGLIILLYERISGGVMRNDYALLLMAFFPPAGENDAFTAAACEGQSRLSQLAGLICAESMALWRAFESTESGDDCIANTDTVDLESSWVGNHPMLTEIETVAGGKEIESLALVLKKLVDSSSAGIGFTASGESPVSLAVLSFGLLLCLCHDARPALLSGVDGATEMDSMEDSNIAATLRDIGSELVHVANDVIGAFDYLMSVMDSLTGTALAAKESSVVHDVPYDWQLSEANKENPLLLENEQESVAVSAGDENSTPADIVTYTSIAKEVMAASIAAFPESLAIDQLISCQDLRLLCTVTAKIYENNCRLCQQFWDVWEMYLVSSSKLQIQRHHSFPICRLLEASHRFAAAALSSLLQHQISSESFVSAASPFFQLLSAFCYNSKITESIIDMLPSTMIRAALLCCVGSSTSIQDSEDATRNRAAVLKSLQTLANVATSSKTCLARLRESLEEDPRMQSLKRNTRHSFDGPRVLARILYDQKKAEIIHPVLGIMAHLLDDAPQGWTHLLARQFIDHAGANPTSRLIPFMMEPGNEVSHSAVLVLAGLIGHLDSVVFSDGLDANDAVAYLESLGAALISASINLSTSSSKEAASSVGTVSVETAESILQSFANFLKLIRTAIALHKSPEVSMAATLVRDRLIGTLATSIGLGESIVYYAIAPVSLGIVVKMEEAMRDKSITERMAKEGGNEPISNFGISQSLPIAYKRGSYGIDLASAQIIKFVSTMQLCDFHIESVQARGWVNSSSSSGLSSVSAAFSALHLLSEWASHVEDIAQSHSNSLMKESFPLSGKAAELILQLSPQRLLCTLAPTPTPCRANVVLAGLWESMGMSTFELLLPYLQKEDGSNLKNSGLPISATLDLLLACFSQVLSSTPARNLADSFLVQAMYRNPRFSSLIWTIIDDGFRIAESSEASKKLLKEEETCMMHFFVSLRILSKCVCSDAVAAVAILHLQDDSGLISKLMNGALRVRQILDLSGTKKVFASDDSILKMRIASGCMDVMAALWKTARSISPANADDIRSLLVKAIDQQSSFIRELAQLSSSYVTTNLDERIAVSRESNCASVSMLTFFESVFGVLATEAIYSASKDRGAVASDLLMEFAESRRLLGFQSYQLCADSAAMFAEAQDSPESKQLEPSLILQSFPATSSNVLSYDFFVKENSFNLSSSSQFLAAIGESSNEVLVDVLKMVSVAYLLRHSELALMESWGSFLSVALLTVSESDYRLDGSKQERISVFAGDALQALQENLHIISLSQAGNSRNRMIADIGRMAKSLSDLLLTLLEMGAFRDLSADELSNVLGLLSKVIDGYQVTACPESTTSDLEVSNQIRAVAVGFDYLLTVASCLSVRHFVPCRKACSRLLSS